jgi:hypothetical protein
LRGSGCSSALGSESLEAPAQGEGKLLDGVVRSIAAAQAALLEEAQRRLGSSKVFDAKTGEQKTTATSSPACPSRASRSELIRLRTESE